MLDAAAPSLQDAQLDDAGGLGETDGGDGDSLSIQRTTYDVLDLTVKRGQLQNPAAAFGEAHLLAVVKAAASGRPFSVSVDVNAPGAASIRYTISGGATGSGTIDGSSGRIAYTAISHSNIDLFPVYSDPTVAGANTVTVFADARPYGIVMTETEEAPVYVMRSDLQIPGLPEADEETLGLFVPLNDHFDERNTGGQGEPLKDNAPDAAAGHRIVAGDPDLIEAPFKVLGSGGLAGTWRLILADDPATGPLRIWEPDAAAPGDYIRVVPGTALPRLPRRHDLAEARGAHPQPAGAGHPDQPGLHA